MGKFLYSNPEYHRYKKQEEITCELLKRRGGIRELSQTQVVNIYRKQASYL